ncbi:hypothetical protein H0H81_007300, partial [Sphagnurus paluster]
MIALGRDKDDTSFPPLELKDTYQQSTLTVCQVGDSRRADGPLWTMTGVSVGARRSGTEESSSLPTGTREEIIPIGTQGSKAKKRVSKKNPGNKRGTQRQAAAITTGSVPNLTALSSKTAPALEDGWIWRLEGVGKLSEIELQKWAEEGDRVQWFRAEAEMQRWQEEWEIKQAEFMRCIRTFQKMSIVWSQMATANASSPGHVAYARKKSAMYVEMERATRDKFIRMGYGDRLCASQTLANRIMEDRIKFDTSPLPMDRREASDNRGCKQ